VSSQAGPKLVDEGARRAQAGQFDDCLGAEVDTCAERQPFESQARRRDVLAQVAWTDFVSGLAQSLEQLRRDKVYLAGVWQPAPPAGQIPVTDERAGVGIAFDAMVLGQQDLVLHRLAEAVARACGNGNHCPWIDVRHLSFERGLFPAIIGCRKTFPCASQLDDFLGSNHDLLLGEFSL